MKELELRVAIRNIIILLKKIARRVKGLIITLASMAALLECRHSHFIILIGSTLLKCNDACTQGQFGYGAV